MKGVQNSARKLRQCSCGGITLPIVTDSVFVTCREISRSKCTYCLGVFSCLLVVIVAASMQTLLEQSPIIFMREAESEGGQVDLVLTSGEYNNGAMLNYTQVAEVLAASPRAQDYSYTSPRISLLAVMNNPATCDMGDYRNSSAPEEFPTTSYDYEADNTWMYTRGDASYCQHSCMSARCNDGDNQIKGEIFVIDSAREKRMGYGRKWKYGKIPPGQVILHVDTAAALNVEVGDTIFLRFTEHLLLRFAFAPEPEPPGTAPRSGALPTPTEGMPRSPDYAWPLRTLFHAQVALSVKVFAITGADGKIGNKIQNPLFMELEHFLPWLAPRLHPLVRHQPGVASSANPNLNVYHHVHNVNLNIPPESRLDDYVDSNYDHVQNTVVTFAGNIMYLAGFPVVDSDLPLLKNLRSRRFVSLYLGLLMNIILFIMFVLSCLLIYSLLLINVGSRAFELAIRRMLGSTRPVLVLLLAFQALSYSMPAWVFGLLIAEGITSSLMGSLAEVSGLPVEPGLTSSAALVGSLLAVGIPLIAAIGPITGALGKNLRDALDIHRPKTSAVKYDIERAENAGVSWSIVAIGTSLSVFGFCIYYLIPLSLLSLNLSLFFNIFFAILLGMLFGLVILALNMEITLEKLVVYGTLFWERPVMRRLTISNLVTHRVRNRKTMVMYSLSIAFIVFITTAVNMEIQSSVFVERQNMGARVVVESEEVVPRSMEELAKIEAVLAEPQFAEHIYHTCWITHSLYDVVSLESSENQGTQFTNVGRVYEAGTTVHGVSPSFTQATFSDYYTPGPIYEDTSLTPSAQLYTVRGSQGAVIPTAYEEQLGVELGSSFLMQQRQEVATGSGTTFNNGVYGAAAEPEVRTILRPLKVGGMLTASSVFLFSDIPGRGSDALVSLPSFLRFTNGAYTEIGKVPMWRLLIDVDEDYDAATLTARLAEATSDDREWEVTELSNATADLGTTQDIMNFLFATVTVVALFLCFFSLMASMVTNIREQTKEAGVLRALGLNGARLVRVFVYEAYALVLASSLMGVIIGVLVGWTFSQQRSLFTQLPVFFWVPWLIVGVITIASVVCSVLAAAIPGRYLSKMQITELLRTVA